MTQITALTEGVLIRVSTQFRADVSQTTGLGYFFSYRIDIENQNQFTVQLLHRDWFIFDSLNPMLHVSGEGVVGQQPILEPGELYQYTSSCELKSEMGSMHGFYTFRNMDKGQLFKVDIPVFQLNFPGKLN